MRGEEMNAKRFTVITMCLGLLFFPAAQAIAGSVQCKCITVKARGTGNSSCSASESGEECMIDYNTFDESVENKAHGLVKEILGDDSVFFEKIGRGTECVDGLDPKTAMRLSEKPSNLVDQILVYSMVSVVQNEAAIKMIYRLNSRALIKTLRDSARKAAKAFIGNGGEYRESGVLITQGCIEIRYEPNLWAMYKSKYSKAAGKPQCGID
jgi:hypothetical protein